MELGLFSQKKVEYQNEDINRAGNDTLSIAANGNDSFTCLFLLSKDSLEFLIVQGGTGKIESVMRRKEVLKPPR